MFIKRHSYKSLLPSIVLLGFAGISPMTAFAQAGAQGASADGPDGSLELVTVTAERRSVNLQQEVLSVTSVPADALDKSNITDLSGLNGYVPGLLAEKSSGSELMISIRGIGSETPQNLYTQPGVSVFIDGIYIPTALGVYQGFFDMDRVEVLRGPQGTIFGQSSTGGAISIVTKQPELDNYSGQLEASYGNYDLSRERLGVNIPVSDTVAVRAAFQHYQHDGFGEDIDYPGYGLDDANDTQGKLSVLWKPTDNFSATLTARIFHEAHHGAEQKNILDPNPDPREVEQDLPSSLEMDYQIYSAALVWDLPFMTVKSTTGYQDMGNNQSIDDDRLDSNILGYYDAQPLWKSHSNAWTQEFDFLSRPGGALDWIAGLFFIHSETSQYIVELRGQGTQPAHFDIPPVTGPGSPDISYEENSAITRESWAPFFQATYHIADRLRLIGGLRYNHDAYTGAASFYYSPLAKVPSYSSGTLTGKGAVEFDLAPDNMIYASWTRGYKPGGINNAYDGTAVLVKQNFETETVQSWEVGSKNEFFDGTLRLNGSGFYSLYHNMQYLSSDPVPYQDGTANIPRTRIWGGELEGAWLAMDGHLRVNGNLTALGGVLDDNYDLLDAQSAAAARAAYEAAHPGAGDYDPGTIAAVAAAARNSKGFSPPKLPNVAGSIDAAYTIDIGRNVFTPRVEYVYRGGFNYRVFDDSALDNVSPYGIWNLYLEYLPPVDNLRFSIAATNIGNKAGIGGRFTDPYGSGQTSNEFIAPRQIVFSAQWNF